MAVRKLKPVTPSQRDMSFVVVDRVARTGKTRVAAKQKGLLVSISKVSGRNNSGRITVRHKGGGRKRLYRLIDFKRAKLEIPAVVTSIEYDPNRSCFIAAVTYRDGERSYLLAPLGVSVGDVLLASEGADIKPGNSKSLGSIPTGTLVHNIELSPGAGGQLARSAGVYAQVMAKEDQVVLLRLPSGELRRVRSECRATIGQVGNLEHEQLVVGKAGRSRRMGIRPSVRGVAMNPVDHPLGGGEGRTSGGRHPVTPWGMPTRGFKTRKNKRTQRFIVKRRDKK